MVYDILVATMAIEFTPQQEDQPDLFSDIKKYIEDEAPLELLQEESSTTNNWLSSFNDIIGVVMLKMHLIHEDEKISEEDYVLKMRLLQLLDEVAQLLGGELKRLRDEIVEMDGNEAGVHKDLGLTEEKKVELLGILKSIFTS